jgi:hypothetical protein
MGAKIIKTKLLKEMEEIEALYEKIGRVITMKS